MLKPRPLRFTSVIFKTGSSCLPLFQLVLSDPSCEENGMCINDKDEYPNEWYIWLLLLTFLLALLCGTVLSCLQCWLRRRRIGSSRCTVAVVAVGDLDSVYETEAAANPTVGIHLQAQSSALYPAASFNNSGPPPSYEEIVKFNRF